MLNAETRCLRVSGLSQAGIVDRQSLHDLSRASQQSKRTRMLVRGGGGVTGLAIIIGHPCIETLLQMVPSGSIGGGTIKPEMPCTIPFEA
jgi:hypothetical protein